MTLNRENRHRFFDSYMAEICEIIIARYGEKLTKATADYLLVMARVVLKDLEEDGTPSDQPEILAEARRLIISPIRQLSTSAEEARIITIMFVQEKLLNCAIKAYEHDH